MKHIITLITVAFTLSLGACCSTGGSTCPMGGKAKCADKKECCGSKTCKKGSCKH